jgi:hypothetical protein
VVTAGKAACNHVKAVNAALLAPRQLGFGILELQRWFLDGRE